MGTGLMTIRMKNESDAELHKSGKGASRKIWPVLDLLDSSANIVNLHHRKQAPATSRKFIRNVAPLHNPTEPNHDPESFHCAIGCILGLAQCFGLLPVCGVLAPSPKSLNYNKKSARTIYAIVVAIVMVVVASVSVLHMLKTLSADSFDVKGGIGAATAGAVFYLNSIMGSAIFLWLAPRWAPLQSEWRAMERLLDRWSFFIRLGRPQLRRKFSVITAAILLFALIEHILSVINSTPEYIWETPENSSLVDFLQTYVENSHPFILTSWNYTLELGIFLFIVSKIATFTWNFTDLFVMLVSTGLAERYKTLNRRVTAPDATTPTVVEWRAIREYYATLSSLVKRVDNDISPIILLSFTNNLYFICLQLLNGLSRPKEDGILKSVYFFGSFGFLVARTVTVTLLAARINDQSKVALPTLYTCPSSSFCLETQRLQYQISTDDIALTGLRFFSITRNFMLAVAGAIVTYEVVLLQFNVAMNK